MTTRRVHSTAVPAHTGAERSTTEPKPTPGTPAGLFLSPRVIDEDAFAHFAGALRDAAASAKVEREALKADMVEVRRLASSLDADWGPSGARMKRLGQISQALQGIESRLARVDDALARLDDANKAVTRAEAVEQRLEAVIARAEQTIADRQRGLEAFLDERLASFSRGLHERITGADTRLEQHARETERKLIEHAARIENMTDQRAEALRVRLAAQLEETANATRDLAAVDVSRSAKELSQAIDRAESIAKLLDGRSNEVDLRTRSAEERITLAAEVSMNRLSEHLEARGESLRAKADDAERRAERAIAETKAQIKSLNDAKGTAPDGE